MATLTGPPNPYNKQFYIPLVKMLLPHFSSPTLSMYDVAAMELLPYIHRECQLFEFPHSLTPGCQAVYFAAYRASQRFLCDYFRDIKYAVMGDIMVTVDPELPPGANPKSYGAAGRAVRAHVALELLWEAIIARDMGEDLEEGMRITTRAAVFLDFRNGQFIEQRIYHCAFPPKIPLLSRSLSTTGPTKRRRGVQAARG